MMIKVFTPNKFGKIEFSKEDLESLLNEVYNQGYSDGTNYYWTWNSPTITTPYYYTTTASTGTAENPDTSGNYTVAINK